MHQTQEYSPLLSLRFGVVCFTYLLACLLFLSRLPHLRQKSMQGLCVALRCVRTLRALDGNQTQLRQSAVAHLSVAIATAPDICLRRLCVCLHLLVC